MLLVRQGLTAQQGKEEGSSHNSNSDDHPSTDSNGRIYYLSGEERDIILRQLDEVTNQGENYRLHLLRLARLAGIEPEQLLYLRRLAGLGVTAIEN